MAPGGQSGPQSQPQPQHGTPPQEGQFDREERQGYQPPHSHNRSSRDPRNDHTNSDSRGAIDLRADDTRNNPVGAPRSISRHSGDSRPSLAPNAASRVTSTHSGSTPIGASAAGSAGGSRSRRTSRGRANGRIRGSPNRRSIALARSGKPKTPTLGPIDHGRTPTSSPRTNGESPPLRAVPSDGSSV